MKKMKTTAGNISSRSALSAQSKKGGGSHRGDASMRSHRANISAKSSNRGD